MSYLAPIVELARNDFVQEKLSEAARLFYTSDSFTINLLPALIAGALLLFLAVPLLALLFQPAAAGGGGYGAPAAEYGAPSDSYGPAYRSDEGYNEFRSLFTNLLDSDSAAPQFELTKRMQHLAGPALSQLGEAAAKLIQ